MIDPPRKEVKNSIKECKDAGIKVKIITGDSLITAKAVAKEIGVVGKAITGSELEKLSEEALNKSIGEIVIFARTTPHQKLRIAKALQNRKEVIAMTGDGINDVLALKSADIGIAMGQRGTDVARDVSDVVLIDDNFASIVEGVKQGRKTYDNIKKFTKYMLSVNFSTILLVSLLTPFGFLLPILPLQILWKNLVTDSFPALTLVLERAEKVMQSKPRRDKSILHGIWKWLILGGILNFLAALSVYFIGLNQGLDISVVRTMVVTTGIVFELLFVYTCRSKESLFRIGVFSNKWLNYAVLIALVLHLLLLYTPASVLFNMVPLLLSNWLLILPFAISGVIIFELAKLIKIKLEN
jgi:Ca2+-transporting ATPase